MAQFLLKDGQRGMWVVGNKVITVTTSGGGSKSSSSGLCENCLAVFQKSQNRDGESKEPTPTVTTPASTRRDRRRHKSVASLGRSQTQVKKTTSCLK